MKDISFIFHDYERDEHINFFHACSVEAGLVLEETDCHNMDTKTRTYDLANEYINRKDLVSVPRDKDSSDRLLDSIERTTFPLIAICHLFRKSTNIGIYSSLYHIWEGRVKDLLINGISKSIHKNAKTDKEESEFIKVISNLVDKIPMLDVKASGELAPECISGILLGSCHERAGFFSILDKYRMINNVHKHCSLQSVDNLNQKYSDVFDQTEYELEVVPGEYLTGIEMSSMYIDTKKISIIELSQAVKEFWRAVPRECIVDVDSLPKKLKSQFVAKA